LNQSNPVKLSDHSETSNAFAAPVLIVGAGPVGITLAMDLAWRGVRSIVIEARATLPASPRCNTTNARTMEIFRRLGCADAVRAAGLPLDHNTDVVYMTALNGHEIHRFQRPTTEQVMAGTGSGISADWPTPEPQHLISQLYMEPVLRRHAVEHFGVDLRLGFELVSFAQDEEGVCARVRELATGQEQPLRAAFLVGADGSNSVVRRGIGARLEGIGRINDTCSVFMRSRRLTELYREHPGWMYRFLGGVVLVAINGIDEWLLHSSPPAAVAIEDYNPKPAIFAAIGEAFDYEVINLVRWTARALVCNKFHDGRVFLAGDAAHIWIPMGGFGMNAGVGDAVSLGWRLAGALQGWLDRRVLDTHESERILVGARVATQAMRWGAQMRGLLHHHPADYERLQTNESARAALGAQVEKINGSEWQNVGMQLGYSYIDSPLIDDRSGAPPPFTLDHYLETSAPGVRAPHLWLEAGKGPKRKALFDQFGKGFTLLRLGVNPPAGSALIAAAAVRNIPLTVLDLPQPEASQKYQGWPLVLVRPDQHIAWRGRSEPQLRSDSDIGSDSGIGSDGDSDYQSVDALLDRVTGRHTPEPPIPTIAARLLRIDLQHPAGLYQRRGRLLVCDGARQAIRWIDTASDRHGLVFESPNEPSAIAYLPSGRLIFVTRRDAKMRIADEGFAAVYADLAGLTKSGLGALTIDRTGASYICDGDRIIRVDVDRKARVVLDGLGNPAGLVITPDGNTLLIAEPGVDRVAQCRISPDGTLNAPRSYVALPGGSACAGLAIGRNGTLWVCLSSNAANSSDQGGEIRGYNNAARLQSRIELAGGSPTACALSEDEHSLYIVGTTNDGTRIAGVNVDDADVAGTDDPSANGWLAQAKISGHDIAS
jgi:2-polyprenyl-6-methoxyphenol hydroxylase-like FAD-dependent oxidoreductase/sugar lactone lactonase YvrE